MKNDRQLGTTFTVVLVAACVTARCGGNTLPVPRDGDVPIQDARGSVDAREGSVDDASAPRPDVAVVVDTAIDASPEPQDARPTSTDLRDVGADVPPDLTAGADAQDAGEADADVMPPTCVTLGTGDYVPSFCREGERWPYDVATVCWAPAALGHTDFATWAPRIRGLVMDEFVRPAWFDVYGWEPCNPDELSRGVNDPSIIVASLDDGTRTSADLGAGPGGVRRLVVGVGSPQWQADVLAAFFRVFGFRPTGSPRAPSARLTFEETSTLIGYSGQRPGGIIFGMGGRCLEARDPAAGGVRALEVNQCWISDEQTFAITDRGGIVQSTTDPLARIVTVAAESQLDVAPIADAPEARFSMINGALIVAGSLCLAAPADATSPQKVVTAACDGGPRQRWTVTADGVFRNGAACLTVPGGRADVNVVLTLEPCTAGPTQRFFFRNDVTVRFEDLCWDIAGGAPVADAELQLWFCKPTDDRYRSNQVFFYRGHLRNGGRCVTMPDGWGADRARLETCDGGPAQVWDVHLDRVLLER